MPLTVPVFFRPCAAVGLAAALSLIAGGGLRAEPAVVPHPVAPAAPAAPAVPPVTVPPVHLPAPGRGAPDSFADLAARLLPAVVNVSTTETVKPGDQDGDSDGDGGGEDTPQVPNFPEGSPFEKFFHDFMNRQTGPEAAPRKMQALGSGFIIDPSGIVVTNNHVVRHADQITVTLQDNTVLKAHLLGHDDRTDLAVLKVDAPHPLPAVPFGDSDHARVGDWVLAIGNPFGLSGTVTAGIISSRGRNIEQGPYDDFIQTDAPINKGNSGGPLFDMQGQVIGINTAIYSPSGGSIGIGFSIPSAEARGIIDQLRRTGKVSRGWIGVRIQDVTQDIADGLGLKVARGALIAGIEPKGPAAAAKLQTGDVIQTLDGKEIDGRALPRLMADESPGRVVSLGVWRHGHVLTVPVTVGALPEEAAEAPAPKPAATAQGNVQLQGMGFTVGAIDDVARQKYSLAEGQKGVVVTAVAADGPAADRGLRPGDVITEVQQSEVASPADLRRLVEAARAQHRRSVLFLVQNGDGLRWVPLPLVGGDGK
ncbi:protease Do [Gluconacetobacter diazotrophicus PA1 5]|uniref:Probable periplasmic serine endoprotease DegP-like n=2 Tax=Gluconacetobacter diazotrophicus (strain ATCC 49037 / DSM 5601 / CCUG 37298 / CIP 103539 / LMG 7603 / PAl5) TaxID=272568 RepID=A9HBK9_GLUDA|nr:DegQ family serine endoprotease [Gluconacetobacter diazotrophicus]ACI50918.1 protease Do [Gluconacetobacter diazotrophicus PA1 5]TWB08627.1 serine protease Do [Gluconacetobacter diazotrophicus]CAP54827.1 putative serine protease do-like precursor [Gluconacetobacter diazotrophicus PA1 5]